MVSVPTASTPIQKVVVASKPTKSTTTVVPSGAQRVMTVQFIFTASNSVSTPCDSLLTVEPKGLGTRSDDLQRLCKRHEEWACEYECSEPAIRWHIDSKSSMTEFRQVKGYPNKTNAKRCEFCARNRNISNPFFPDIGAESYQKRGFWLHQMDENLNSQQHNLMLHFAASRYIHPKSLKTLFERITKDGEEFLRKRTTTSKGTTATSA